jgi:restriction system protein
LRQPFVQHLTGDLLDRPVATRIKVRVKRRENEKVSAESLCAVMAVLGDQDVGIYISAAGFSAQAEREERSQEKRRLKLVDLERFIGLWVQQLPTSITDACR